MKLAESGYYYCSRCQQVKPISDFQAQAQSRSGVRSPCKSCQKLYEKQRNATEKRKNLSRQRTPEKRAWRRRNIDRVRENARKWRRANADKRRAYKQRYHPQQKQKIIHGLYVLKMGNAFKIGKSANVYRRVAELRGLLPFPVEIVCVISINGDLSLAEWTLHQQYRQRRLNGEWFALTPDDIQDIKKAHDVYEG